MEECKKCKNKLFYVLSTGSYWVALECSKCHTTWTESF